MKIKIPYINLMSDWITQEINEIETDDFSYFRIENRGSTIGDWWIVGYRKKWLMEMNLTGHGCYLNDVIKFYHENKNKVKQINVLHFDETNNSLDLFFNAYANYLKKVFV